MALECGQGERACGGSCVDLRSNREHCGACAAPCAEGEVCSRGQCTRFVCPSDQEPCDGGCVDTSSDLSHCGACGQLCSAAGENSVAHCIDGVCQRSCAEGLASCEAPGSLSCEASLTDDVAHCGSCNNDCNTFPNIDGAFCHAGKCVFACEPGWGACEAAEPGCTTELQTSLEHCGTCYNACSLLPGVAEARCSAGECEILACAEGRTDCDGDPENGCEAELNSLEHCGSCGTSCKRFCDRGSCDRFIQVVGGMEHSCALTSLGTVACWGRNESGQLGVAVGALSLSPVELPGLQGVKQLAAGARHTCALLQDGSLRCWGLNDKGQLGDGSLSTRRSPTSIPLQDLAEISLGAKHSCARSKEGELHCWGDNESGQLGIGSFFLQTHPTPVPGLQVQQLALGGSHSCALLSDGTVRCWGENSSGQLGDAGDSGERSSEPVVAVGLSEVRSLSAGALHSCALLEEGSVRCWGDDSYSQLGLVGEAKSSPTPLPGLSEVEEIDSGDAHSCARFADGSLRCWGYNALGQLGGGPELEVFEAEAVRVLGVENAGQLGLGAFHSCLLHRSGAVSCWGANTFGALGNGDIDKERQHQPVPIDW